MNKRGQEELSTAVVGEYVIVILVTIMLLTAVYKLPQEERINKLKAIDLGLVLESVSSVNGDVILNYDLGEDGMNVEVDDEKIKMYKKTEAKAAEEFFIKSSNYEFTALEKGHYYKLIIKKEGNAWGVYSE